MSLKQEAVRSLKWSALGETASQVLRPLLFLVLTALLTPADFGIVAAATLVMSFSEVVWSAGFAKALVQRETDVCEVASAAFWVNMALGWATCFVVSAASGYIADFFNDPRIGPVVCVMSLQAPLAAAVSAHCALLQREFQFKKLFWINLTSVGVPAVVSVPLALFGYGYWALVIGSLVGRIVGVVLTWGLSPWRPSFAPNRQRVLELWLFGRWVTLSALLGWLFLWLDSIFVGHYLSIHLLGIYNTGKMIVALLLSLVASPTVPIVYSLFSRVQSDREKIREGIAFVGKAVTLIITPLGVGIYILGASVLESIVPAQWSGIGVVVGFLALGQAIAYTVTVQQEAYRSIGRPGVETAVMAISILIRIPFYAVSVRFGLLAFVVARLISTVLGVGNHIYFAARTLGFNFRQYLTMTWSAFLGSAAMVLFWKIALLPNMPRVNAVVQCGVTVLVCVALYGLSICVLERQYLASVYRVIRENG